MRADGATAGCAQDFHFRVLQHRGFVRHLRGRSFVRQPFPETAGQQAVFLRDWRERLEPQAVPDEWERGGRLDRIIGGGVRLSAR